MKELKTFCYCEHCNAALEQQSPPANEQYESSMITIRNGDILLPSDLVKRRTTEGHAENHAESLSGVYCGPACLKARIDVLLGINCL